MESLGLFLILGCVFGNEVSCSTSAQAFGRYSRIEKNLQEYGNKHKEVSYLLAVGGAIKEKRVALPLVYNLYTTVDSDNNTARGMLTFRKEFQ